MPLTGSISFPSKNPIPRIKSEIYSGSYLDEDQPLHWIEPKQVSNELTCPEGKPWMEEGKNRPEWVFYPSFYAFASKKRQTKRNGRRKKTVLSLYFHV